MRQAHKVWAAVAAGVFVVVAISDLSRSASPTMATSASTSVPAPTSGTPAAPPTSTALTAPTAVAPSDTAVTVTRVIDGDTVEVSSGRTVQVLGIDACGPGTYGGDAATSSARAQLGHQVVALVQDPGVTIDRHGYDLRRVVLPGGGDFAEDAVAFDHTVAYGGNGAPDSYLSDLRARDDGPQRCAAPVETAPSGGGGSVDWPTPGDQGLPDGLLTGGYCAKKWWC